MITSRGFPELALKTPVSMISRPKSVSKGVYRGCGHPWPPGRMVVEARDVDLPPYVHWFDNGTGGQPRTKTRGT